MKIKLLLLTLIFSSMQIGANAAVSVDKTLSEEYMLNNGYSKQIYNTANVARSRALGEEFYSSEELKYQKAKRPVRWWHKFHAYLDPAIDDFSFYHHDINPEPRATDL